MHTDRNTTSDLTTPAPALRRGTIMRDTNAGPGLLMVDGVKHVFTLEQHWRGAMAPQVQMAVDVGFGADGAVDSVSPAQMRLEDLDKYKKLAQQAIEAGNPVLSSLAARIGMPVLAAVAVLMVCWIWLPMLNVTIMAGMRQGATLFDVLRLANAGASLQSVGQLMGGNNASSGLYGVLCVLAMLAPLAAPFIQQRKAALLYCAPLAFLLLLAIGIWMKVREMAASAREGLQIFGGAHAEAMADAMAAQIGNALSLGLGAYVSLAAALYLAWIGVRRLAARH